MKTELLDLNFRGVKIVAKVEIHDGHSIEVDGRTVYSEDTHAELLDVCIGDVNINELLDDDQWEEITELANEEV